jgi:hypothetical protein
VPALADDLLKGRIDEEGLLGKLRIKEYRTGKRRIYAQINNDFVLDGRGHGHAV